MGNVSIPQERDERYLRITLTRPTGDLMIQNGVSVEDLHKTVMYHHNLGRTIEKIEMIHVVQKVTVTEVTPKIPKKEN